MSGVRAGIVGLGTATPANSMTQPEAARVARALAGGPSVRRDGVLELLYRRTKVRRRGSVVLEAPEPAASPAIDGFFPPACGEQDHGPTTGRRMQRFEVEAAPLAARAARAALDDAGVDPSAVDHLVVVSCTGFASPGVDLQLVAELGLPRSIQRTQVGFMGCHGAINGLRDAAGLVESGRAEACLVCAVELCSLHFHYRPAPDQVVANALFADGAAAALIGRVAESDPAPWRLGATSARLFPEGVAAMSWRIGDHGFQMTLSPSVPRLLAREVRPWIESWLDTCDLGLDEIGSWAIHPGGPGILAAVAEALSLDESALRHSEAVLAEHGNMSSATSLFVLDHLRRAGASRPCVALAFGPGLAGEAALIE